MIIKSRFKDYYDFVANIYGGGDPKIVYMRDRISLEAWVDQEMDTDPLPNPEYKYWPDQEFELRWLIVAGKPYMLYRAGAPGADTSSLDRFQVMTPEEVGKKVKLKYCWSVKDWVKNMKAWHGTGPHTRLVELSRSLRAPVFVIESLQRRYKGRPPQILSKIRVHGKCPILAALGMASIVPATQMYQDLAYFVGNLMNVSPDKAPPVEVGNKSKILNAGFDLRWSFRHRTS